ncbi:hypothetical protein HF521_019614 [Silurus meridionalis]|uniref:Uncharacterized protein n=1 Tax=Silurus meridionalis TaxID=175797 RepID=A0A8T0BLV5_SILME|nr:hypothetical protein HF521_019614 [Silurus meridionalis]
MRNMLIQRSLHQMNRMPLTLKRQNNQELFLNWLALQCFPSLCCSERADDTAPTRPTMSPKRSAPSKASGKEPKCQRTVMTLHKKVKLLDMLAEEKKLLPYHAVMESTRRPYATSKKTKPTSGEP